MKKVCSKKTRRCLSFAMDRIPSFKPEKKPRNFWANVCFELYIQYKKNTPNIPKINKTKNSFQNGILSSKKPLITSNCNIKVIAVKKRRMIKSMTLSEMMVPKALSKGTLSYRLITKALDTSPERGMVILTKYPIKTAIILLSVFGK